MAARDLAQRFAADDVERVHIGIFDIDGIFRHKRVSAAKAAKLARDGYPFCDVLYEWDITEEPYGGAAFVDRPTSIDPASLRIWPFEEKALLCVADFEGEFGLRSPRVQLARQLALAADMGFTLRAAFEFEFFVFDETPRSLRDKGFRDLVSFMPGNRTYSAQTAVAEGELLRAFEETMTRAGIGFSAIHTELGPGCFEMPLAAADGIKAADDAALFKTLAKAFFLSRGLMAGFMSKWSNDWPGQSGHLHLSLHGAGGSAFADPSAPDGLSETVRHFIGGVLDVLPDWLAMCAHTSNAYKRLVPGAWAPVYGSWGVQNRTAAVRAIPGADDDARIEFRVPSADTNPFLSLAMCLGAGLRGIRERIAPPPPRSDDCYATDPGPDERFPRTLLEAAERFAASAPARETFGDAFVDHFIRSRLIEDEAHRRAVTEWELRRYLEVV